jgi:glycosyltransferase involved in cell wall biosynthesis
VIKIFDYIMLYLPDISPIDVKMYAIVKRLNPKKFTVAAFANSREFAAPVYPIISTGNRLKAISHVLAFNPQIIHTRAMMHCWILRRFVGFSKHVLTLHGMPGKHEGYYYFGKMLAKDADVVTCVSHNCAELAKAEYGVESKVIYDGVETEFFTPKKHSNSRLRILFVGRLVDWKKPQYVVKLAKAFPECDFIIHGRGDYSLVNTTLKNVYVDTQHLSREGLRDLYASSDIFLFPSIYEGLGDVVLEAMACGLPVVCFNVSALPEVVDQSKNGLLSSNLQGMEENLDYLIHDATSRQNYSKRAREKALNFDWKNIVPLWEEMYESLEEERK